MTRNNLDIHLSWLLSQEFSLNIPSQSLVTNPIEGVGVRRRETSLNGQNLNQENSSAILDQPENSLSSLPFNVGQDFQQQVFQPTSSSSEIPDASISIGNNLMGKLSVSSRSGRPGLISQNKIVTPKSSSTLQQEYASFLRDGASS